MPGDEVIDSDLDDSEGELDDDVDGADDANVDYVFCVYDKVSLEDRLMCWCDGLTDQGATRKEQVEDGVQGWHDSHQWSRLPLPKVQRVSTRPHRLKSWS